MAVDLHRTGVSVKLIEPGPVDTEIWDQPDNDEPLYHGPKVQADEVADGIIAALGSDRFEHYVPDMKAVVDVKNADLDTYIAGAAAALATKRPDECAGLRRRRRAVRGARRRQPADPQPGPYTHLPAARSGSATAARRLGDHPTPADRHLRLGLQADPARLRRG